MYTHRSSANLLKILLRRTYWARPSLINVREVLGKIWHRKRLSFTRTYSKTLVFKYLFNVFFILPVCSSSLTPDPTMVFGTCTFVKISIEVQPQNNHTDPLQRMICEASTSLLEKVEALHRGQESIPSIVINEGKEILRSLYQYVRMSERKISAF